MFDILILIAIVFVIVAVVSYLKNLDPDLRKEQIKTIADSGLVVTGFAATSAKDLVKTALNSGKAASHSVEKNHREASKAVADSVNNFVAEHGGGNALRAGAKSAKDLSEYSGLKDLNQSLEEYIQK